MGGPMDGQQTGGFYGQAQGSLMSPKEGSRRGSSVAGDSNYGYAAKSKLLYGR